MYIKIKFLDSKMTSCVLPLGSGDLLTKIKDGEKLELTPLKFSEIFQLCDKSKVLIQEIDVKEFKGVSAEPAKEPVKEPVTKDVK